MHILFASIGCHGAYHYNTPVFRYLERYLDCLDVILGDLAYFDSGVLVIRQAFNPAAMNRKEKNAE